MKCSWFYKSDLSYRLQQCRTYNGRCGGCSPTIHTKCLPLRHNGLQLIRFTTHQTASCTWLSLPPGFRSWALANCLTSHFSHVSGYPDIQLPTRNNFPCTGLFFSPIEPHIRRRRFVLGSQPHSFNICSITSSSQFYDGLFATKIIIVCHLVSIRSNFFFCFF